MSSMNQDELNQVFALLSEGRRVEGWTIEPVEDAQVLMDYKRGDSWMRRSAEASWTERAQQN